MNSWHRQLLAGEVKRRNRKTKPIKKLTGGPGGNAHQRAVQRRASQT